MEQNQELQVMQTTVNDTVLYLLEKAQIDTAISTAKAYPRSVSKCLERALSMVMLSEDIAASCSYSLPRGGSSIDGKSIRLAEIIAANYSNLKYGGQVISNDGKKITAQGVCMDLENNVSVSVNVSRSILNKKGLPYNEDMQTVTGNAAIAIAIRNAIFKVIPSALTDSIYEKAKEIARGTVETLVSRRGKALEYFNKIGVTNESICAVLELQTVNDIDLDRLARLTGFKAAIKNGESTVKEIFENAKDKSDSVNAAKKVTII